ncbi:sugar phosphate isomerase/epimerase [soil metagenome]
MTVAAGTGLLSCTPTPQQAPRRIRWAMGWLLWRDFKGRDIPLQEALQDLHELGLDGIEFTPRSGELEKQGYTRESFIELLNELNLQVSGHYFSAPFYDTARKEEIAQALQERIDSIKSFGGKNIIIGPPDIPSNGENHLTLIKQMAPVLNDLGKRALDQGVEIGLHPHLNTIVETPEEIHAAMEATDPSYVFMSPDTGHIYLGGGDVVEILRTYQDRLNYFHFKDGAGTFTRPDFFPNMRELGRGEVDFPAVMKLLNDIGYTGWINVEQDFTNQTTRKSAEQSMEYINKQLKPILRS